MSFLQNPTLELVIFLFNYYLSPIFSKIINSKYFFVLTFVLDIGDRVRQAHRAEEGAEEQELRLGGVPQGAEPEGSGVGKIEVRAGCLVGQKSISGGR